MIRNRSDANTLQRHFQGGIQQIWLPELGVVDRCTSCHVGLKEASLTDVASAAVSQPSVDSAQARSIWMHDLPPRPGRSHDGCRSAQQHARMGTADSSRQVHRVFLRAMPSRTAAWNSAAESGTQPAGSREGCVHCHTVKLPDGSTMKATDDPPSLSHIADKTTREWIFRVAERSASVRARPRPCRTSS